MALFPKAPRDRWLPPPVRERPAHRPIALSTQPSQERISGSHKGYHVAAYACPAAEDGSGFIGYFKVCRTSTRNYWDADCLLKGCGQFLWRTAAGALTEAEELAWGRVAALPTLDRLPAFLDSRPIHHHELDFICSLASVS
jgi:hypothetical protein